ncbi:hypothetical protein CONLIGDRAFT_710216 [Coniochaeta ligniaria NRRL 30616]|uniref:Aminoglycoside phosphotransferase domain-containing protein n=1 Tax=Coniochaeta ligniaria NRRL 30616 TaxID=1408157 RepID=A0A1J7J5A3_9PEZI|nr:hypothetical protein CONLIGDRAFT_710216 [Coniochaeta ligniaria NRRL 30616]
METATGMGTSPYLEALPDVGGCAGPATSPDTNNTDDKGYAEGLVTVRWVDRQPQVLNLCKELWPSALNQEVHNRSLGGWNELIPITITLSESEGPTDFILRLPNQWSETPVIESVAILHYVQTSTEIRVPDVIAYDTTTGNALKSPYIIMERLGNQDLDDILDDLTAQERTVIAAELGQVYKQLRKIRSAYSGKIVPASSCHLPSLLPGETLSHLPIAIEPYGALLDDCSKDRTPTIEIDGTPKDFIAAGGLTSDPPNATLHEMVTRAFDRRIIQCATWHPWDADEKEKYSTMRAMASAIVSENHVANPTGDFCLWHPDLFPRNIMVDPTRSPMITGIVDWDEAVLAPGFVAAVAPTWLWEPGPRYTEDEEDVEGAEGDKEAFERANRVPLTAEMREVKRVFEQAAGDECLATCTSHYAIIARRLMMFVLPWQWTSDWTEWYEETLEEWKTLRTGQKSGDHSDEEMEDQPLEDIPNDDSVWETCSEDLEPNQALDVDIATSSLLRKQVRTAEDGEESM